MRKSISVEFKIRFRNILKVSAWEVSFGLDKWTLFDFKRADYFVPYLTRRSIFQRQIFQIELSIKWWLHCNPFGWVERKFIRNSSVELLIGTLKLYHFRRIFYDLPRNFKVCSTRNSSWIEIELFENKMSIEIRNWSSKLRDGWLI